MNAVFVVLFPQEDHSAASSFKGSHGQVQCV